VCEVTSAQCGQTRRDAMMQEVVRKWKWTGGSWWGWVVHGVQAASVAVWLLCQGLRGTHACISTLRIWTHGAREDSCRFQLDFSSGLSARRWVSRQVRVHMVYDM